MIGEGQEGKYSSSSVIVSHLTSKSTILFDLFLFEFLIAEGSVSSTHSCLALEFTLVSDQFSLFDGLTIITFVLVFLVIAS